MAQASPWSWMPLMHGQEPNLRNPERFSFVPQGFCSLLPPLPCSYQLSSQTLRTTYKPPICPDHTAPLPSSAPQDKDLLTPTPAQPVPPSLITTLAPPGQGQGGTDLCLRLAFSRAEESCFPLDIKGQKQIRERDPQLDPLRWSLPTHRRPPPGS